MKYLNNKYTTICALFTTMFIASCSQQPGSQQVNGASITDSGTPVDTGGTITGTYLALSADKVDAYNGDTFTLDITANDLPTSEGGSVSVTYDSKVVQVVSVKVDGEVWKNFVNRDGQINNSEGRVSDIVFSSYEGVSGDVKVATIEFKSVAPGETEIMLHKSPINPFSSNGEEITVSFAGTSVTVN